MVSCARKTLSCCSRASSLRRRRRRRAPISSTFNLSLRSFSRTTESKRQLCAIAKARRVHCEYPKAALEPWPEVGGRSWTPSIMGVCDANECVRGAVRRVSRA
eukprot:Amastigsp_a841789_189.p5 type:complete len:103 gc:universal Amastigsp_a841789_189:446-754(+)